MKKNMKEMKNDIKIALRIQNRREKLNYSREKLAELAGIGWRFLADIETATKGFSLTTLTQICKALDVSADYILFGETVLSDQARFLFSQMNEKQQRLSIDILTNILKHSD